MSAPHDNIRNEDGLFEKFLYNEYQKEICRRDNDALKLHNKNYPKDHKYHLQKQILPCPFEGDLLKARVILLLANPHYKENESSRHDHLPITGWGIWGLSKSTSKAMHAWWRPRLRNFISNFDNEDEWQKLSWKVASFQSVPWASEQYHHCDSLPSKKLLADTLRHLASRRDNVTFVVMRNRSYWTNVLNGTNAKIIYTKNPRCSYLTLNNLQDQSQWIELKTLLGSTAL